MLNQCNFIGRLGQDPEIRYTQTGVATANFTIATSETWVKDGVKKEKTEWIRIVAWERLAEIIGQYLKKGSLIFVGGKLQTRKWTDKEGAERYTTEIVAKTMKMLGGKADGAMDAPAGSSDVGGREPGEDDDIPF